MLCQACSDMFSGKSARWKGSYKATFDSGDGSGQPNSNESTALDPEADWDDSFFCPSKPGGFVHHQSGRAFLAAAHQGCQLCLRLYFLLSPKQRLAIAEEPEDLDISSADYDYVVGYSMNFWEEYDYVDDEEWKHRWIYAPGTLNGTVETGGIGWELIFYASKGVLRQSSQWPRTLN